MIKDDETFFLTITKLVGHPIVAKRIMSNLDKEWKAFDDPESSKIRSSISTLVYRRKLFRTFNGFRFPKQFGKPAFSQVVNQTLVNNQIVVLVRLSFSTNRTLFKMS